MRLPADILCVLLSISFVLMPLSHLHAHISGLDHQHVNVHGGHNHDIEQGHSHRDTTHENSGSVHLQDGAGIVLNLKPDLSQGSLQKLWNAIQWVAVLFVVAIVLMQLHPLQLIVRPPRTRTRPPSPYPHALPLLRGPPLSI